MHEQLSFRGKTAVTVKWDDFPHFTFPWHFHPEYELVYVIKSFGKRFVGDHIEDFSDGDLVLLGSNLPHFWKNDDVFFQDDPAYNVNAIVIHFPADFFKQQIEDYPEFLKIKELLQRSARGICFHEPIAKTVGKKLKKLLKSKGLECTLDFVKILDKLARTKDYKILSSGNYNAELQSLSSSRIDKVLHIINSNYREDLKLETVAHHAGMNKSAFCRFFKEKTGKSFSEFLIEMRIGYACKLLIEDQLSVSQICFESGFNNLSNFNRQFKKQTSFTPVHYKNQFHKAHPTEIKRLL